MSYSKTSRETKLYSCRSMRTCGKHGYVDDDDDQGSKPTLVAKLLRQMANA